MFDAFPIFDPRPLRATADRLFEGRGEKLMEAWRTRQFEYQWLRALGGHYADFSVTARDALEFSLRQLGLEADAAATAELLALQTRLHAWPDVPGALARLRLGGFSLAFLSNMTEPMLSSNLASSGLAHLFDARLSTDLIRSYKPDPRAYRLAIDRLRLRKSEILFVAFAGWDASGAKWFGYETFWVNRLGLPAEELDAAPDGAGRSLADLVAYVNGRDAGVAP